MNESLEVLDAGAGTAVEKPASPTALKGWYFLAVLLAGLLSLQAALSGVGWLNEHLLKGSFLPPFAARCADLYLHIAVLAGALIGIELLYPGHGGPKRYGRAALFWALYVPVSVVSADFAHWAVQGLGIKPLFSFHFESFKLGGLSAIAVNVAAIALGAFLFDFFYYWFHRLQHAVPVLWAFHSVHHANSSINVLSCYHHPLEDLWRLPLFLLPIALVFEVVAPPLFLVTAFVAAWGLFNHMDSGFNLGRARWVLADNHYHRLHHSIAEEHYDRNFAGMFSLWDRLFHTQTMPPAGVERLAVGLTNTPDNQTVAQYVSAPFVLIARMLRRKRTAPSGRN